MAAVSDSAQGDKATYPKDQSRLSDPEIPDNFVIQVQPWADAVDDPPFGLRT
jgi:hypothetical protein